MLLTNNITNICSEISKIPVVLRETSTCSVKRSAEVEKMGRN